MDFVKINTDVDDMLEADADFTSDFDIQALKLNKREKRF